MPPTPTQHLTHTLALDFLHNKTFNPSILQLLCQQQKLHASTTEQQILQKVTTIDKAFQLLNQSKPGKKAKNTQNLCNLVNVFVFNVSVVNEHYLNEIERQMVESTAEDSRQMQRTFYKDKIAVDMLKEHLRMYFEVFVSKSSFLSDLLNEIAAREPNTTFPQHQLNLLQTVDYLCVKYAITAPTTTNIIEILQLHQQQQQQQSSLTPFIHQSNNLLFSSARQSQLYQLIQTNPTLNLKNLLGIIIGNWKHSDRKLFMKAELCGREVVEGVVARMVKRVGKNQLFGGKMEEYAPFRLLAMLMVNMHFAVYDQFNAIVNELLVQEKILSQTAIKTLKHLQRMLRVSFTVENPNFHQFIQFIFSTLSAKYSQTTSLELIKKLILNRFLLNPSFFVIYNEPSEERLQRFVQVANIIRSLFYPTKAEQLAQKTGLPIITKLSSQIIYSLEYCLKSKRDPKTLTESQTFLYINDKILKSQMQQFHKQFTTSLKKTSPRQAPHIQNLVSEYSLSFSLVKNEAHSKNYLNHPVIQNVSQVKFAGITNRSNTNVKDNQSIRYMYDQLRGQSSRNQIPPKSSEKYPKSSQTNLKPNTKVQNKLQNPKNQSALHNVSQLARKQHQVSNQTRLNSMRLPTDREMIEELVQLRKQHWEHRRALALEMQQRRRRCEKRMALLAAFSARFNQFKEQVQRDNNQLYVHMTTIA